VNGSRVARRYARALLELAPDTAQLEAWGAELERLAKVTSAPELAMRLNSPELPEQARIEAMAKIGERLGLSFPLRSFGIVVARHRRIAELPAMSEAYLALVDEALGRVRATLTFARKPSDAESGGVVEGLGVLTGKTIISTITVDPALLGGVVAQVGDTIYDGSLAARLMEAQRRLIG
jgi:F-type H+-transporting ATPase subunit delta